MNISSYPFQTGDWFPIPKGEYSEIINEFKTKAKHKHIEHQFSGIPEVETISAH